MRELIVRQGTLDPRGDTDDERARRHVHARRHQRSRADHRAFPDDGAVEDPGAHADQRAVPDGAAVHDRTVPDGDVVPDDRWPVEMRHVNRAVVLHIRVASDADRIDVAADGRREPDRTVVAQLDVADHRRVVGDEYPRTDARMLPLVAPDDHQAREISMTTRRGRRPGGNAGYRGAGPLCHPEPAKRGEGPPAE